MSLPIAFTTLNARSIAPLGRLVGKLATIPNSCLIDATGLIYCFISASPVCFITNCFIFPCSFPEISFLNDFISFFS